MEKRWLSTQELLIPRDRRLVMIMISMPRCSTLMNELTEQFRLFIAPSQHGRDCLNQIGRRWQRISTIGRRGVIIGVRHSAINHELISPNTLIKLNNHDSN
jgi:hypothetical protein